MNRILQKGVGWRVGWWPDAPEFKGLVGGDEWALELTELEFRDFCRLLHQLADTLKQMAGELMEEERITCEAESELIWLEVEGFPQAFSLRFMVLTGRRAEGNWSSEVVPELLQALQTLPAF
ncbi:MAG: DUF1818 family protein [Leptolyngbyaceae cyanobacterium bins.59]|nr:DUF1818 family protein [Leptolyngbyaceae cyanobacterium bins.59]